MRVDSIPEEHKVLCPQCGKMLTVPPVSVKKVDFASWTLRSIDGQVYGPYSEAEVGQLIAEFRVISTSELNHPRITESTWKQAKDLPQFNKFFLSQAGPVAVQPPAAKSSEEPALAASSTKPHSTKQNTSLYEDFLGLWKDVPERPRIVVLVLAIFFVVTTLSWEASAVVAWMIQNPEAEEVFQFYYFIMIPILAFFGTVLLAIYAMPSIVAFVRFHQNAVPILIVNICFGWTFLGWGLSLAWSFSTGTKADDKATHIHTHVYTHSQQEAPPAST